VSADRLTAAIAAIDEANACDPNVIEADGELRPKELVHAERMTGWVTQLDPDADEAQLIAARAHHLRRWEVPRGSYPEGRAGYLRWRSDQKKRHATDVGEILDRVGYDDAVSDRVQRIVRKEGLGTDPAVQIHEDSLCLVFLELQLTDLVADLGRERAIEVLRRTAPKMSPRGLELALTLPYDGATREVLLEALAEG
jgi:hypothetical protein